ncbi:hypothetical protein BJI67_16465 (plasmid) [Acidihalobacter aeolianus]|uniref:AAA domain-containing protein n=1 Tax=Acidihalobacter aeolianus TaxID=2792603 RepID=A0A1D8KCZ5_9GAMM|nr:ParA family protein [Acidihalobacter aeolianus]AOV18831.1 hypothetical protein BJI67_16465 [Acidihalobacter aeolianus]
MAMRVATVGNFKGGTGKTLLSKQLGEDAAILRGLRTLLVDLDPQGNLSRRFLEMDVDDKGGFVPPIHPDFDLYKEDEPEWDGRDSSASIWLHGVSEPYPTRFENLHIIPAHSADLQRVDLLDEAEIYSKVANYFRDFIWTELFQDRFDIVVIDTRPSQGPLVQAALHASTHVVIPTQMESPSVEGLQGMISLISQVNAGRSDDDQLKLVGILANMFRTNLSIHQEFMAQMLEDPTIGPHLLDTVMHDWAGYKMSMVYGSPSLFQGSKSDKHYVEARQVCDLIIEKVLA